MLRAEGIYAAATRAGRGRLAACRDVDLSVRRGEVLGVFGLMGAGRTELLETLFGLHPRDRRARFASTAVRCASRSPADAIAAGLALAPEDRKREGLVLPMSVAANASLASLGELRARRADRRRAETATRRRTSTASA